MALVDNRLQRTSMLCAMYVAQGIPWGFMVTALANHLAAHNVGDAELGKLTAIVLVPWTFKLVWAPLIDTVTIRSMGRRRPWIIGAEIMMAVSMLWLLAMGDLTQNLQTLAWMFFVHNCFASLQDVATDALAVDILPPQEQGRINGMMWGSKLLGKAVGGGGMAIVMDQWGIPAAVGTQFCMLLVIMLFPLLLVERPGEKRFPWSKYHGDLGSGSCDEGAEEMAVNVPLSLRSPISVFKDLLHAFSLITTGVFVIYGATHVIGWGILEVLHKSLYIQQLGWSAVQVSTVSGGYAVVSELTGAIAGGIIADRVGRRFVMTVGFGIYGLLAILFGACPHLWHQTWFAAGFLILNPGALAMGAVGFLSMGMKISWTRAAATVFTIFMTLSNVGHVIGNSLVGPLREQIGLSYESTFLAAGAVTLIPLLLLIVVNPKRVDEMKSLEK